MATITKTAGTSLLSLQSVASNTVVISSAQDVSTKLAASVLIHFGRRANTALTNAVTFRVEASAKASTDGFWFPLAVFSTNTAVVSSAAVNGTCSAGQNVVAMTVTTGETRGDIVYIDNTTIANSEWGRVKLITASTSITLEDNLNNAQTGSTVYPSAEMYFAGLDLTAVSRIRLVVDASGSGQAIATEAFLVTGDSIA